MNDSTKSRGPLSVRTDDSIPGVVSFFDRNESEAAKAKFATFDLRGMDKAHIMRLAVHGATQLLLDSSNKMVGDARKAHIQRNIETVRNGGWASSADPAKIREDAIAALMKFGKTREQAEEMIGK